MSDLTRETLIKLMQFRPNKSEVANFFLTSEDTIERRIKEWDNCTYSEFRECHSYGLKQRLQQKAIELALNGNVTMMIFCLKNLAGWGDENQSLNPIHKPVITLAYAPKSLRKIESAT